MKVAYLLGSLNRGGTETLFLDIFNNSDKAEFEFIGIHRKDGPYKEEFYASKSYFTKCRLRGMRVFSYLYKLRQLLIQNKVDIVHTQQTIDTLVAHIACLWTKIRIVETFHGYDYNSSLFRRFVIRMNMKWCDAICFVSNEEKCYYLDRYGHRYADKSHVVYNGVNFDKIICRTVKSASPKATNAPSLKLGAVGNFVRGREQSTLCKFLHLLDEHGVDFDFYFVGRKDDNEPWRYDDCVSYCVQNGLMDKVHFLGSRNDVPEL